MSWAKTWSTWWALLRSALPSIAAALAPHQAENLLQLLGDAPCNLDQLVLRSGLTAEAVLAILLPLELEGRLARLPGGRYQRLHPGPVAAG